MLEIGDADAAETRAVAQGAEQGNVVFLPDAVRRVVCREQCLRRIRDGGIAAQDIDRFKGQIGDARGYHAVHLVHRDAVKRQVAAPEEIIKIVCHESHLVLSPL